MRAANNGDSRSLGTTTILRVTAQKAASEARTDDILVSRYELQTAAQELLPDNHRTQYCMRHRVDKTLPVTVEHSPSIQKSHYSNVQTCGSIWTCPVCAAKITERRRKELAEGVRRHTEAGGGVILFTFTGQHFGYERIADVLSDMNNAHRKFWASQWGRRFHRDYGIEVEYTAKNGDLRRSKRVYTVRGLEVTFSDNGAHVHYHTLVFVEAELSPGSAYVIDKMGKAEWQKVLGREGRYADRLIGFEATLSDEDIARYVAKFGGDIGQDTAKNSDWTLSHEVAKSHVKTALRGGRTPNRLLYDYIRGDKRAGELWREYVEAFRGKSQLKWSRGLRELLGLVEQSDESLAQDKQEDIPTYPIAIIPPEDWQTIIKQRLQAELLIEAAKGNQWGLRVWLWEIGVRGAVFPQNEHFSGFVEFERLELPPNNGLRPGEIETAGGKIVKVI